nr:reverse transcriptase domain-containing protein [Tanacetum cinerariifolium]
MTTPTFAKTHNLLAYLEKPAESEGFEQIIDFLNESSVKYALTASPTVCTSCIKQFWSTAKVKTINDEVRVQALIDAKRVTIKESSICRTLKLDDEEGNEYDKKGQNPSKTGQNQAQNGKREKVNSQRFLVSTSKTKIKGSNLDGFDQIELSLSKETHQAPIEGYEDAIVVPAITADNFKLKHGLLTLVQNKQFFGHDKEDPHAHFFPPSKTTNLRNEITNFQQRFNESFSEAWDRFKDLFRACPHHGFSKLHQLDIFYNALNLKDQDSLNSVAGGNFLDKIPRECLAIIESKSKVRYSRNKPVVAKVSTNTSTSGFSPDVAELKNMIKALLLDKKGQNQSPAPVKAVEESCFMNSNSASTLSSGTLPSNTIANTRSDLKAITTQSGVSYDGPQIPPSPSFLPKVVENEPDVTKDTVKPTNNGSTEDVQPQVVQSESKNSKPVTSLIYEPIFKDMSFEISFADALILMPKFASTLKALIGNKENLSEMARTLLNEHCSAVLPNKLPKKLGDPGKFQIPCDFSKMAECLALADLGASINLMPFFVWKRLSLPDLTPMCMTLELADRSISCPVGVTEDVYVKVGSFHFSVDFVVVDFDADPRVPLILGRSFLKTERALIDVFEVELTLRVGKEAITFNLDQTSRYSANYSDTTAKRIDVIDMACEEYSQEVLGFSDVISSGNPTSYYDLIVSATSSTLTSFENSDFLLESYLDSEGDILLLEAFLNDEPSLPPPNQGNYLPEVRKELKICEAKSNKSSIDEPSEVELKDLPPHLEYAFLEGDDKLPVIIAKDLSVEEKTAVITVLKSHKRSMAWKLFDIKVHDVIKQEVIKLLEAGFIYPISDSPWVSPVHCVPKKGGFTVVENEENELILTHLVTGWRVCIHYRKLNEATRKDHFPLPFMDQMLERLAGNQYYCFLDGFSGYFQIPINPKDREKTTFTCPYETFAYRRMLFGLCNAPGTFQRCMMAIFHDMIEKTMEVFMDDFLVYKNSFQSCLSHLERMVKRCKDTNLCLNWEKSHFMVKEGDSLDCNGFKLFMLCDLDYEP